MATTRVNGIVETVQYVRSKGLAPLRSSWPLLRGLVVLMLGLCGSASRAQYTVTVLRPVTAPRTTACAVDDNTQVGNDVNDAMLWHGTAASSVDLSSTAFNTTYAYAVSGGIEAGCGTLAPTGSYSHALLWAETSQTAIGDSMVG